MEKVDQVTIVGGSENIIFSDRKWAIVWLASINRKKVARWETYNLEVSVAGSRLQMTAWLTILHMVKLKSSE